MMRLTETLLRGYARYCPIQKGDWLRSLSDVIAVHQA